MSPPAAAISAIRAPIFKIFIFIQLAHFQLTVGGRALDPIEDVDFGLGVQDPIAGDDLFRLAERAIDHCRLALRVANPRGRRARFQAFAGEHHARVDELLVVSAHLLQAFLVGQRAGF